MIEALIAQLGAEKQEERAKAIAERKDEEADFLATATPKEKGRMRGGGRGGRGGALVRGGGTGRLEEIVVVVEENDVNDCSAQDVIARTRRKLEYAACVTVLYWIKTDDS